MRYVGKGNPDLRWFEAYSACVCGKAARGVLRGVGNASYGPRCQSCADRELKAADKARAALSPRQPSCRIGVRR